MKKNLIFLPFLLYAYIENSYFNDEKRGWFFYETNSTIEQNNTKKKKQKIIFDEKKLMKMSDEKFMKSIPLNNLDMLSAESFKKIMTRARQIAVMKPTKSNVLVVKKMEKFTTDQAEKYAKVWYVLTLENPNLEYPQIKTTPFAQTPKYYAKQREIKNFFDKHKKDLAFVVFMAKTPQNHMINTRLKWIYKDIEKEYGIKTEYIDIKERPNLVKKFNIKELPDNFFVYKNKKGELIWERIKAGLVTKESLVNNTMFLFKNAIQEKDK